MNHCSIKFCVCLLLLILVSSCSKKETLADIDASVYIIKSVDSLPCQVYVEYYDVNNGTTTNQIASNWTTHKSLHLDQYATLKATSVSNVKSLSVEIKGKGTTVSKSCTGNNCTVDVRKNMYD